MSMQNVKKTWYRDIFAAFTDHDIEDMMKTTSRIATIRLQCVLLNKLQSGESKNYKKRL